MSKPAWLSRAESQIGYTEKANNDTKYGKYYGLNNEPWCALFVSWCCATSKHPLPVMQPGMKSGYAAVSYGISWARSHGLWIPSWEAKAGDAICYGWDGPRSASADMHTGLVVSSGPKGSTGHTVEGNRDNQVGRFTFTVGEDVVLGCIDLDRLLNGRPRVHVTAPLHTGEPAGQPRHPEHPTNTGPSARQARRITRRLKGSRVTGRKRRSAYRHLRDTISKALHRK